MTKEFNLSEKIKGRDIDGFVFEDIKQAVRMLMERFNERCKRYDWIEAYAVFLVIIKQTFGEELTNG